DTWTKSNATPFSADIIFLHCSTRVAGGAVLYVTLDSYGADRLMVRDGGSWFERSAGLPAGRVWKVIPNPWAAYADEAWAILSAGSGSRLFRTENRGVTWTEVTGDFPPDIPISDIVVNPWNTNELAVGTYIGCFRSRNGGANWERWTVGMPGMTKITELSYNDLTPIGGQFFVVAASYGRSVWKRDISGDDPLPTVQAVNVPCSEGDHGTTYLPVPVTLSAPSALDVTVDYATADGSATVAGKDYESANGTLVIPA